MRPNVVFVVLDTVRADRVSTLGYDRETTPNFDAFAEDATLYTDAVAQAPWSVPSHASLFTGTYPWEHGTTTVRPVFDAADPLPVRLARAGYETYAVSANEYVRPVTGFGRGFDEFVTPSRFTLPGTVATLARPVVHRVTNSRIRRPVEWLFNRGRRQAGKAVPDSGPVWEEQIDVVEDVLSRAELPYFLFVSLLDCHLPRSPAPTHWRTFVDRDLRDVPVVSNERAHLVSDRTLSDREWRAMDQLYDADLRTMDDRLGELLARLEDHDDGETLVVLVSDHGEHLGEFDLLGHQYSVFDPVVSVPMAIRYPDGGPDRVDHQVETRRVYHTILDETGLERFPEQSLASGAGDPVARGAFVSPMVDIEELLWEREFTYETDLLGEPLSFRRRDGQKLVRFDEREWLFDLPEREDGGPERRATAAQSVDRTDRIAEREP